MGMFNDYTVALAIATIFLLWTVGKLVAFFKSRQRYQRLPGPPYSLLFGHLISLGKIAVKLPSRAHSHTLAAAAEREYDLPPVYYIDSRPVSLVSLIITDP